MSRTRIEELLAELLDELLSIPLSLQAKDLQLAIMLCDTAEQLNDPRLLEELREQNKANKEMLKRLWAERRHLLTEGLTE